jgi:hypothetical protein
LWQQAKPFQDKVGVEPQHIGETLGLHNSEAHDIDERRTNSTSIRFVQVLVLLSRNVRCTLWVFVRSRDLQGFAHEAGACRRTALGVELFVDISPDRF